MIRSRSLRLSVQMITERGARAQRSEGISTISVDVARGRCAMTGTMHARRKQYSRRSSSSSEMLERAFHVEDEGNSVRSG